MGGKLLCEAETFSWRSPAKQVIWVAQESSLRRQESPGLRLDIVREAAHFAPKRRDSLAKPGNLLPGKAGN